MKESYEFLDYISEYKIGVVYKMSYESNKCELTLIPFEKKKEI